MRNEDDAGLNRSMLANTVCLTLLLATAQLEKPEKGEAGNNRSMRAGTIGLDLQMQCGRDQETDVQNCPFEMRARVEENFCVMV